MRYSYSNFLSYNRVGLSRFCVNVENSCSNKYNNENRNKIIMSSLNTKFTWSIGLKPAALETIWANSRKFAPTGKGYDIFTLIIKIKK